MLRTRPSFPEPQQIGKAIALVVSFQLLTSSGGNVPSCFASTSPKFADSKSIQFPISFRTNLDSRTCHVHDSVEAELTGTLKIGDSVLVTPRTILTGYVSSRDTGAEDGPITVKFDKLTTPEGDEIPVEGHLTKQSFILGNGSKAKRVRVNADGQILQMCATGPLQKRTLPPSAALALGVSIKAITSSAFLLQSLQMRSGGMTGMPGMMRSGGMNGPPPMGMGGGMAGRPPMGMGGGMGGTPSMGMGGGMGGTPPMGMGGGGTGGPSSMGMGGLSGMLDVSTLSQTAFVGLLKDENPGELLALTPAEPETAEGPAESTGLRGPSPMGFGGGGGMGGPPPMGLDDGMGGPPPMELDDGMDGPPPMGLGGGDGMNGPPSMGIMGGGGGGMGGPPPMGLGGGDDMNGPPSRGMIGGGLRGSPLMGMMGGGMPGSQSMGMMGGGMPGSQSMGMMGGGSTLQDLLQLIPVRNIPGSGLLNGLNSPTVMMARSALPLIMQLLPKGRFLIPNGPPGSPSPSGNIFLRPSPFLGSMMQQGRPGSVAPNASIVHIEPGDELIVSVAIRCEQINAMRVSGKLLSNDKRGAFSSESTEVDFPQLVSQLQINYVPLSHLQADSSRRTKSEKDVSIDLAASFRNTLDSNSANVGDRVEAVLNGTLSLDGRVVAPPGAELVGYVARVGDWRARQPSKRKRRGRDSRNNWITIIFSELVTPYGERIKLRGAMAKQCIALNNHGRYKVVSVNDEGAVVSTENVSESQSSLSSWSQVGFQAATTLMMMRNKMPKPPGTGGLMTPSAMPTSPGGGTLMTVLPLAMRIMSPAQSQMPGGGPGAIPGVHIARDDQLLVHLIFDYDSIRRLSLTDRKIRTQGAIQRRASAAMPFPPPRGKLLLPSTSEVEVEFMTVIDTRYLVDGDKVQCRLTKRAILNKHLVAPMNSVLWGHIEDAQPTRRLGKALLSSERRYQRDATFRIVFTSLATPNGGRFQITGAVIPQCHVFKNAGKVKAITVGKDGNIQKVEDLSQEDDGTLQQTVQTLVKTGLMQFASPTVTFAAMPAAMGIIGAVYPCVFTGKSIDDDDTSHTRGFVLGATSALPAGGMIRKFVLKGDELVIEKGDRLVIRARTNATTTVTGTVTGPGGTHHMDLSRTAQPPLRLSNKPKFPTAGGETRLGASDMSPAVVPLLAKLSLQQYSSAPTVHTKPATRVKTKSLPKQIAAKQARATRPDPPWLNPKPQAERNPGWLKM